MKQIVVLEALKPLECVKGNATPNVSFRQFNLNSAGLWLRHHLFSLGVISGVMAFISLCLSMDVMMGVFSILCFSLFAADSEKGGRK